MIGYKETKLRLRGRPRSKKTPGRYSRTHSKHREEQTFKIKQEDN